MDVKNGNLPSGGIAAISRAKMGFREAIRIFRQASFVFREASFAFREADYKSVCRS